MTLYQKILIWVGAILVISALAFIIYQQSEISKRQNAIEQNMVSQKQLVDGIVRSQSSWATSDDIEKTLKDNQINVKSIKDDLDKLHAEIAAINIATATSNTQHVVSIPTKPGVIENPNPVDPQNPDPFGYMKKQQLLELNETFGSTKVPIGSVGFSAWQKEPWNYDIKGREYRLNTIVGVDENQRQYFYNKFVMRVDGIDYTIPIQTATTQQTYPEPKWYWWNPRLFVGLDGGINVAKLNGEFTSSIDIGIMSYGMYRNSPDFSILSLGVGYGTISAKPQFIFTPVTYNIGKHIPLMNNMYFGPSLHVSTGGDISIMSGIRVGL